MSSLRQSVANYHVGTLIIDGAENIAIGGERGLAELDALLRELRDDLHVSAVITGTYTLEDMLLQDQSVAQRFCDGFYMRVDRYQSEADEEFIAFTDFIGMYQWIKKSVPIAELRNVLYDCSQGITRVLLDLFILLQSLAIDNGDETITKSDVLHVYQEHFKPIHRAIDALRTGDEVALRKFEGFFPKAYTDLERTGRLSNVITAMQSTIVREYESDVKVKPSRVRQTSIPEVAGKAPYEDLRPVDRFPEEFA